MQHGDPLPYLPDDVHVMLDQQHRVRLRDLADELRGLVLAVFGHAGGRLVEQQQLRIGSDQHAELEPLPFAVRQRVGRIGSLVGQFHKLEDFPDAVALRSAQPLEQRGENPAPPLQRHHDVVEHRQRLVHVRHLKLAADAGLKNVVGRPTRDVAAGKVDRARSWLELAGDHANQRRLAGTVRAEQHAQLVLLDAEVEIVDDGEARHARGEAFDFEKVGHPACFLISPRAAAPAPSILNAPARLPAAARRAANRAGGRAPADPNPP